MTDERKRATPAEARAVTLANGVEVRVGDVVPLAGCDPEGSSTVADILEFPRPSGPSHFEIVLGWNDHDWHYGTDGLLIGLEDIRPIDLVALAAQRAKAQAVEDPHRKPFRREHASGRIVTTPEQRAVIADAWDAVRRGGDVDDRDRMEAALRAANLLEDSHGR